jgi:hypothetical protein
MMDLLSASVTKFDDLVKDVTVENHGTNMCCHCSNYTSGLFCVN